MENLMLDLLNKEEGANPPDKETGFRKEIEATKSILVIDARTNRKMLDHASYFS